MHVLHQARKNKTKAVLSKFDGYQLKAGLPRSALDYLTCNKIFRKSLRIVEDDKHCGLGDVVSHAVISEGYIASLFKWGCLH